MKRFMLLTLMITLLAALTVACADEPTSPPSTEMGVTTTEATPSVLTETAVSPETTATTASVPATATPKFDFPKIIQPDPRQTRYHSLDAPLEFHFSQPMNQESVQMAFTIRPGGRSSGTFVWLDAQTMQFTPNDSFAAGELYQVEIAPNAFAEQGYPINRLFVWRFTSVSTFQVLDVIPADNSNNIAPDTTITVFFERPMVSLVAIEDEDDLPDVLAFDPPVTGQGTWLDTQTYQFTPADDLTQGTTYTVLIPQETQDVLGEAVLPADYTWQFTVPAPIPSPTPTATPASPKVSRVSPPSQATDISPDTSIQIAFDKPIRTSSVEAAFKLTS